MNVLLVNPVNRNVCLSSPDLGLGYLAAALKRACHKVYILDCKNQQLTYKRFQDYLTCVDFDVIGMKIFSADLLSVKKSLEIIKKVHPKTVTVVGGAHPSIFPQQTLEYLPEADFGFRGEAEIGLVDLIDNLANPDVTRKTQIPGLIWRNKQEIISNPPIFLEDLDTLGMPAWSLIDPRDYHFQNYFFTKSRFVAPILMTRGCPFRCTFCVSSAIAGHKIRSHSVNYILDELKFLRLNFGIKEVCFIDDNFLVFKNSAKELCEQLIKQKIEIAWSCFGIRLDLINEDILSLMEESGCYMFLAGIESGSERILDHMQKKLSLQLIKEKINLINTKSRIKVIGNFILGYPQEDAEDIRKTIRFAKTLPLAAAHFGKFMLEPGTAIHKELADKREIGKDIHWDLVGALGRTFVPRNISARKFSLLYHWAIISFYLRPKILFNVLRAIRSLRKLKHLFSRLRSGFL